MWRASGVGLACEGCHPDAVLFPDLDLYSRNLVVVADEMAYGCEHIIFFG